MDGKGLMKASRWWLVLAALTIGLAVVAAGCGGDDEAAPPAESAPAEPAPAEPAPAEPAPAEPAPAEPAPAEPAPAEEPAVSCIPPATDLALPEDPDGVVAQLTGAAHDAMLGYSGTVYASPWVDFKADHGPPYLIGMSNNEGNLNAQDLAKGMEKAAADNPGMISDIIYTTPAEPNDTPVQIQQMRSLLQQDVDIIFSTLSSPTALNAVIDDAAKAGVPVISILGQSTSKNAVNLQPNPIQLGYYGARGMVENMGAAGDVLSIEGIPGLSINTDILAGGRLVLDACPEINVVGELTGNFDPSQAQAEVLKFLSAHPGEINGVFQVAGMAPGIFAAFEQVGRPVPPVGDIAGNAGSLAYWRDNMPPNGEYLGSGVAIPPERLGEYTALLGLAMLEGRGVKVTDVPFAPPVITDENLDQWVQPDWTQSTQELADGPEDSVPIQELLDTYLAR